MQHGAINNTVPRLFNYSKECVSERSWKWLYTN